MLIVILIISIITFLAVAGNASKLNTLEARLRLKSTFLDDDGKEPDWLETPVKKLPKQPARKKQAVRQTTTLRKAKSTKTQKRGSNGRFA